jgi:hypothetical protein
MNTNLPHPPNPQCTVDSTSQPTTGETPPAVADPLQRMLDLALNPGSKISDRVAPLARDLLLEFDPQDPAEKMLVIQMIANFSRALFLSRNANSQKNTKWFTLYSAECNRTMHLYRKQLQSLADYRRPRRTTFTAIRTANIAGQQVVMTARRKPKEIHVQSVQPAGPTKTQKALPPVLRRKGRPARRHPQDQTLGT